MSRDFVTTARIYLAASSMDVDLTMNAMRLAYKSAYYEDILDAVVSAREQLSKIAAGPDHLSKSAWIQLIRYHNNADMARASMMMRHPCNSVGQIEDAIMTAQRRLHDGDSEENELASLTRYDHYSELTSDHGLLDIGPPWSEGLDGIYRARKKTADAYMPHSHIGYQFARICDVREKESDVSDEHRVSGGRYQSDQDNVKDNHDAKEDLLEFAKIQLVRSFDDGEHAKNKLEQSYPNMSGDIDWAIKEARRLLFAEAAKVDIIELTNFAWIQLVCELFGRRDIRRLVTSEYPYVDENIIEQAMREARNRLLKDIIDGGPWILRPAATYQIILAPGDYHQGKQLAKQKWNFLDDYMINAAFNLRCSQHKELECEQCTTLDNKSTVSDTPMRHAGQHGVYPS